MLPTLDGYAAALLGAMDAASLAATADGLRALEQTVLGRADLRAVLTDTSLSGPVRSSVVREILEGKVGAPVVRLAGFAAGAVPAQEVPRAFGELALVAHTRRETGNHESVNLGLLEARKRVAGFTDALLEDRVVEDFARIEHELFTWARAIETNADLRRLLTDRDAPLAVRRGVTTDLLGAGADPDTLRIALYLLEGGRPRDVVGTLDYLVDHVARARDWRVARVHTARTLADDDQAALARSLSSLTGGPVELQVAEDPALLGGVLVEVGDLRLDASMRGRLATLHESVAGGHLYQSTLNRND